MKIIATLPKENIFFKEYEIPSGNVTEETEGKIINIYDDVTYQEMLGFGGAFTESSAYNYSLMSAEEKRAFLTAYFDKKNGIASNFCRLHIGSCDFSLDAYTNVATGDTSLCTFSIERDKKYIIPFIKDAQKFTGDELVLFASPWSPPAYMKDNNSLFGGGKLKEEYKELWAHFYAKFIKAYRGEGIKISAITVQNEPKALQSWESCTYTAEEERDFIEKYLSPALDSENLSDIKIIIWDHNKERIYDRAKTILQNPKVSERVWAVGHHWYTGDHFDGLRLVSEQLKKPNICTEFCAEFGADTDFNSIAEKYGIEICENINNYCIAVCDWNIMLDEHGGPHHNRFRPGTTAIEAESGYDIDSAGCSSPIMFDNESGKITLTPIYYYVGHFSKYIKRGAKRVAVTKFSREIFACAFINPDGERVAIVINTSDAPLSPVLRINGECTEIQLSPHSIATILM